MPEGALTPFNACDACIATLWAGHC